MLTKMRFFWREMRSSFWFVPATLVVGSVGLAIALIFVDTTIELHFDERWPRLFGAGAAGSRGLLTAVASSMITVAGVVFSITIVALSLTSSQYTPRVLRNFMSDRANQLVLGVFLGIFAYCLVVLRTIRDGDEGAFVPSLAVLGGLGLAFAGIGFLIFFIHHISISIQASSIIAAAAEETIAAVDRLFPERIGASGEKETTLDRVSDSWEGHQWTAIGAPSTGYIEEVDGEGLLSFARRKETLLRMERGVGEFVIKGTPLISIIDLTRSKDEEAELHNLFVITRQRTVQQDAGFGIRQIVDIAMKALSPGVNDTTTAVMCVDYLAAILVELAERQFPSPYRFVDGELRLISKAPSFETMVAEAFDQIRQNSEKNVTMLERLLNALQTIARSTRDEHRRESLRRQAKFVWLVAELTVMSHDIEPVKTALERFNFVVESGSS